MSIVKAQGKSKFQKVIFLLRDQLESFRYRRERSIDVKIIDFYRAVVEWLRDQLESFRYRRERSIDVKIIDFYRAVVEWR